MIQFKEIHYDTIITEFGYSDEKLHIHFRAAKIKNILDISDILDKHLKTTFHKEIKPTGEIIKEELKKFDKELRYSPKFNESIKWQSRKSLFYKENLPQEKPPEFKKAQEVYEELMKLYDDPQVIHKTWTDELNGVRWNENASWGYILQFKSPFLDQLMIDMCKQIDEELIK